MSCDRSFDRLHVHCTSSPSSISSISQHFSSPTDEFEFAYWWIWRFFFENRNRGMSKCIGNQRAAALRVTNACMPTPAWLRAGYCTCPIIDRIKVRAAGRVARRFFDSWIFHVIRLVYRKSAPHVVFWSDHRSFFDSHCFIQIKFPYIN